MGLCCKKWCAMEHITEHWLFPSTIVVYCLSCIFQPFHMGMVLNQGRKKIVKNKAENVSNPLYHLLNRAYPFADIPGHFSRDLPNKYFMSCMYSLHFYPWAGIFHWCLWFKWRSLLHFLLQSMQKWELSWSSFAQQERSHFIGMLSYNVQNIYCVLFWVWCSVTKACKRSSTHV